MAPSVRFSINNPKITHQTIDGEVVIVNLGTGSYYSLDGAGADIWNCLENGATIGEIVTYISQRFDGNFGEITSAIERLAAELKAEGLIGEESDDGQGKNLETRAMPVDGTPQVARKQFSPPVLNKYTDMQDLLLLDPIHDVDETGWPTVKPDVRKEDGNK